MINHHYARVEYYLILKLIGGSDCDQNIPETLRD
jgi:hypothetical protein